MVFQKEDFERMGETVAENFLSKKVPLNDTVLKIASENEMNPEQIKRLVEAANVKTFLKLFERPENKDSNIEFDVADHGDVMKRYYAPKKSISITKITITPSGDDNEFAGDMPSMMRSIRHGGLAKVAEEVAESAPSVDKYDIIEKLRRVDQDLVMKIYEEEHEYVECLEKISSEFAKLYGPDYPKFEREALHLHGSSVAPILEDIRHNIRHTAPMAEKTASRIVVDTNTPEMKTFSKMVQHKTAQVKYAQAVKITRSKLKGLLG